MTGSHDRVGIMHVRGNMINAKVITTQIRCIINTSSSRLNTWLICPGSTTSCSGGYLWGPGGARKRVQERWSNDGTFFVASEVFAVPVACCLQAYKERGGTKGTQRRFRRVKTHKLLHEGSSSRNTRLNHDALEMAESIVNMRCRVCWDP